jgi:hypothetical protein
VAEAARFVGDVAVIVATPSPTAVSAPALDTVATPEADVDHDNGTCAITAPRSSFTAAPTVELPPGESTTWLGATVTDVADAPGPV